MVKKEFDSIRLMLLVFFNEIMRIIFVPKTLPVSVCHVYVWRHLWVARMKFNNCESVHQNIQVWSVKHIVYQMHSFRYINIQWKLSINRLAVGFNKILNVNKIKCFHNIIYRSLIFKKDFNFFAISFSFLTS